jgi:hypothetical protein
MIAVDCVAGKYWFGNNGTWDASGDPANGTNPTGTFTANSEVQFGHRCYDSSRSQVVNFGQDSTFAGNTTRQNNTDSNGEGDFYYAPPTGFLSLNSLNLSTQASPTIDDGSQYFNTVLYSGNGTDNHAITGAGFQPDLVWAKMRSAAEWHFWVDSNRGANKAVWSNATNAEYDYSGDVAQIIKSFDSDGFTLGTSNAVNNPSQTFASWNWLANGGTTSSNTDGTITSTVQANPTAGFSIVTYTGTQANATVGHGLGVAPKFIITKCRSASNGWPVYHYSLSATDFVRLNQTSATATNSVVWNNTEPTSTVFSIGANDENNKSGADQLAYCFAEIEGYSKFGSYTGNGSTDGTFVYTGFRPAFVIWKNTNNGSTNWVMRDNTRNTFNPVEASLEPNNSSAEYNKSNGSDFLSNGFKIRNVDTGTNGSGNTIIYMAFAESPFVTSTGIPVVAR